VEKTSQPLPNTFKIDPREIGCEYVNWINLAQDRV